MAERSFFLLLLFSVTLLFGDPILGIRKLGSFQVYLPGYCSLYENRKPNSTEVTYDLLISSYALIPGPFDGVYIVRDVGRYLEKVYEIKPFPLIEDVNGPKEISGIPEFIFGKRMVAVPDGTVNDLPFKIKGGIRLVDMTAIAERHTHVITGEEDGEWIYHRVQWLDIDRDGDKDIITCRVKDTSGNSGQLIWLENPSGNYKETWKSHVIAHSPDVFFRYAFLTTPEGPMECIVVAGFYSRKLSILWPKDRTVMWSNTSNIAELVVDNSIGRVFDVTVMDVNGDGYEDLLVTNNDDVNGTVIAYEVPLDFRNGTFVRHILASGFKPNNPELPLFYGSPGAAKPVYMPTENTKPILFLSGDGSGHAYYLLAKTQSPLDWSYLVVSVVDDGGNSVGEIATADVDNDGYDEIFIPSYARSTIHVFTVKP